MRHSARTVTTALALLVLSGSAFGGAMTGSGLIVLDTSASGALTMTGNSEVDIPAAAVYVNSSSSTAVRTTGNATLRTPDLYVCGGASYTGQSGCTGTTHRSVAPYQDPLAGTNMPTSAGMTNRGTPSINGGTTVTLQPGYYPSGISVTGNSSVTFAAGVYVLGGNLRITAGTISGTGVTFVMQGGAVSIAGCSSLNLSAPTEGNLAGIMICQPATNTSGLSMSGGSEFTMTGAIYLPNATATLTGNASLAGQGPRMGDLVDVKRITLTGTGSIKIGLPSAPAVALPTMPLYD